MGYKTGTAVARDRQQSRDNNADYLSTNMSFWDVRPECFDVFPFTAAQLSRGNRPSSLVVNKFVSIRSSSNESETTTAHLHYALSTFGQQRVFITVFAARCYAMRCMRR